MECGSHAAALSSAEPGSAGKRDKHGLSQIKAQAWLAHSIDPNGAFAMLFRIYLLRVVLPLPT